MYLRTRRLLGLLRRLTLPIVAVVAVLSISLTIMGIFRRHLLGYESPAFGVLRVENRMGGLRIYRDPSPRKSSRWRFAVLTPVPLNAISQRNLLGFSGQRLMSGTTATTALVAWRVNIPHWFFVASSCGCMIVPMLRHRRQRQEAMRGHCHRCGYDLRATPDRCPECGHAAIDAHPVVERGIG